MPAEREPPTVTTWVENPQEGRPRGPAGLLRSWAEILVRPRRFFAAGVAPGDQAPGLAFGVAVALAFVGGLFVGHPSTIPETGAGTVASGILWLLAVGLFVAPATLHLTAALLTLGLRVTVRDRAGVSETVQVVAYAVAPCALAGPPIPWLRALCGLYGAALLVVGVREVHDTTTTRAAVAAAIPAALVFGYGFRAFGAIEAVARAWTII